LDKGSHSLQFGYEYHQDALNFFDIEAPQGIVYNSGIYSSANGFSGADILLGDGVSADSGGACRDQ